VFSDLFDGSVRGWGSLGYTFDQATPLLIVAVGTIISNRAGQFNIGQEGQLTIGAAAAGFMVLKLHGPGPLLLIGALLAAAAGGAVWAGICAVLRFWRRVDIVISSLLLVFVAQQILQYLLNSSSLLEAKPINGGQATSQSDQVSTNARLPHFGHYPDLNFGSGLLIAIGLAAILFVLLTRSHWGMRLKMLGLNPVMARRAGVSAALVGGAAIVLSGAFAGLAGGVMLTGQAYRVTPGFSNNVGWNGLLVALVARNNSLVAIVVALFFGAIEAGGGLLATANVPNDLVNVVQALLVLGAVFPPAYLQFRSFRRGRAARPLTAAVAG
jgi:simple sugar transport system permease protein